MTKEEYIQSKWAEAGFIWDEIEDLVNESGFMSLPSPELKYTLTGYDMAHSGGLISGIGFDDKGFVIGLDSLRDVEKNNGWHKIEYPSDLPDHPCLILVTSKVNGCTDAHHYRLGDQAFVMEKWSHFKLADSTKPLY